MRWSVKLARIAGIDVRIHVTFLVLLAWIAWTQGGATGSWRAAAMALGSIVLVFGSVLAHEYGHALVARRWGIPTRDITLLPIGGVARLERMPEDARGELAVSVAGPAVNVALAAACFAVLALADGTTLPLHPVLPGASLLERVAWINVGLAVFNLVPAFPMDGGRVLRAILAMWVGHARATRIATLLGQGIAVLAAIAGILWSPLLVLVAAFVWLGAAEEGRSTILSYSLEGIPVQAAMARRVPVIDADAPLSTAAEAMLAHRVDDFPVLRRGRLVGVLAREDLATALRELGPDARVLAAMRTEIVTAHPGEMLDLAHRRMQQHGCSVMPVVRYDGRIVGMLTLQSIAELIMLRAAVRGQPGESTNG